MLLKHTLLYLPAQFVGPLFQLLAMIVWTHVVDEHTLDTDDGVTRFRVTKRARRGPA